MEPELKSNSKKRFLVVGGLLALVALSAYLYFSKEIPGSPGASVKTSPEIKRVETALLDLKTDIPLFLPGIVKSERSGELASVLEGTVEWVNPSFHEGGFVSQGEPLVRLSRTAAEAALAAKQVELEQARLDIAAENIEAMKSVRKYDDTGKKKGDESELVMRLPNRRLANARVEACEAAVREAREALAQTSIDAPYDCAISSTSVDVGSLVKKGETICSIYGAEGRKVLMDAPVETLSLIQNVSGESLSLPAIFKSPMFPNITWSGAVLHVGQFNPSANSIGLIARLSPSAKGLAWPPAEIPVSAKISIRPRVPGYFVPIKSLVNNDSIWVIASSGKLALRKIAVEGRLGNNFFVTSKEVENGDILCVSMIGNPSVGLQVCTPVTPEK